MSMSLNMGGSPDCLDLKNITDVTLCQLWVQPFGVLEISVSYFFEASYVV